jgi:Fe-S cluster assembly protein SufD
MNALDEKKPFLSLVDDVERRPGSARWQSVRKLGRLRFRESSYPGPKTEDWRFTNVAPLLKESFALPASATLDPKALPPLCAPQARRLTFVNGAFAPQLSHFDSLPSNVLLGALSEPGSATESLAKHLAQIADAKNQVFTALNTALLQDGAFLVLPANTILDRPLEILYVTKPGAKPETAQPRTLVVLGQHAQATVVERFVGLGEGRAFTNAVTEFVLDEGAILDHVKIQQENVQTYHVANTQVVQAKASNFTTHSLSFGGALVRNEVRVRLGGEGAEATVNGLYLGRGAQHMDNYTVIDHAMPHCNSHELYKGVLADKAHGVFNGKIFVRKDAQKTDAKQTNKVLLLSDDATINTKPQLEIFADDVKCTHGATIGQLDETQIFYLQSRGIGADDARRILTFAFANDLVGRIQLESIREEIEAILVGASVAARL